MCKWPRPRNRVTHPTTLAQMEKFRQANWLVKYAPAQIQQTHRDLVAGTQLLPRDMMIAAIYGRGLTWQIIGQRRRYPVAAKRDLSETLDILGAVAGDILVRGAESWYTTQAPDPGMLLYSGAPGTPPTWQALSNAPAVWHPIEDVTLTSGLALNAYYQMSVPTNAQELEILAAIPNVATGVGPALRLNNQGGGQYTFTQTGTKNGGGAVTGQFTNATKIDLWAASFGNFTSRSYLKATIFQVGASLNAGFIAHVTHRGTDSLVVQGQWVFGGNPKINQIGLGSISGVGIPAGTRIVTRAAF